MKYLQRMCGWLLFFIAFMVLAFSGTASAMQVAEFGDAGFLNIDYQLQARYGIRNQGPDPTRDETTRDMYLRRNRLSFIGAVSETISFAVQFEYNGGQKIGNTRVNERQGEYDFMVLDYYVSADFTEQFKLRAGKFKHVLTREVNEGCFDALSMDRSLFITGPFSNNRPEKTTRDYGVVAWGNLLENKFQYRVGVMDGNRYMHTAPEGIGYRYMGRAHVTLLDPEAGFSYRGTHLGKKNVLTIGAGYETQPNAVYLSGATGSEDYRAYSYDIFYEKPTDMGVFTLSGAYLKADFDGVGISGAVLDAKGANGEKNGYYWKAGYMIGKAQVFGRYEDWAFAELGGIQSQGIVLTGYGVNYYFKGQSLRLTLEYTKNDFEKENASNKDFNTLLAQLQATF